MRKWKEKKVRTAFCGILLCAFFSGCGRKEPLVLITESEGAEQEAAEDEIFKAEVSGTETTEVLAEEAGSGKAGGQVLEKTVYVYVCGAVQSPGVVKLPFGSRVEEALQAAGGFGPDADRIYVNLAAVVEDGQQLYFPTAEEAAALAAREAGQQSEEAKESVVNINTADAAKLCTLPGIGEARAADIIAWRQEKGLFEHPQDIMKVPGIKSSAYEKIKDKITTKQ